MSCKLSFIAAVLLDARNKYDGTRRSPWNEVECGDHYTRPMAGFLLFEIASGQVYNTICWNSMAMEILFFVAMECTRAVYPVCS